MSASEAARTTIKGATDCHIHIYGPPEKYPLAPTAPYPPPLATVTQYRDVMTRLGLDRVIIVQPAAYGTDNRCTMDAVADLGPDVARAVVVVTPETPRAEIRRLHDLGARSARFFMMKGAVMTWDMLAPVARLIADFGWSVQLQFNGRELPDHEHSIRRLPCAVVFDHIGKFIDPVIPDHPAAKTLFRLLEGGRVWVKASAPYETSREGPPFYEDIEPMATALIRAAPDRVVWATNWPHGGHKMKPDDGSLLGLMRRWCPDLKIQLKILVDNPSRLYEF